MSEPKAHLAEWQLLSVRYGRHKPDDETWADKLPWGSRHQMLRADASVKHWCVCPGTCPPAESNVTPCAQAVTQEDGLCDECRQWCYAVGSAGKSHQFASLMEAK